MYEANVFNVDLELHLPPVVPTQMW